LEITFGYLKCINRREFKIRYATCQSFSRLFHQINGCRSEQKEAAGTNAFATATVDQSSQALEQTRDPVNFVQDDELVLEIRKIKLGFCKLCPVGLGFEVEIERGPAFANLKGERCFSNLPWAEKCYGGVGVQ